MPCLFFVCFFVVCHQIVINSSEDENFYVDTNVLTCFSSQPGIRTNTTVCLGKIAVNLPPAVSTVNNHVFVQCFVIFDLLSIQCVMRSLYFFMCDKCTYKLTETLA